MTNTKVDPLESVRFLEGDWHGDGQGPYGPYDFETSAEFRGRWLLLTGTSFEPKTDTIVYVSTQVYGYDEKGLVLQLFDTAGAFDFRGAPKDDGLQFDWKDGENWKTSEFWPGRKGEINYRYQSIEPAVAKGLQVFEGVWLPGRRPTTR